MPILNKAAKSRVAQSRLQVRQADLQLKQLERQVLLDLDFAAYTVNSNWRRLEAAEKTVELAQKTLAAEEEKMNVGRSTSFYVLDLQSRLAFAKSQKVNAVASYVKSVVEYHRQRGDLLQQYDIRY